MSDCYLVIIEGKEGDARGFLEGLVVGADAYGEIYFINDLNVDHEGLLEHLKELLHLKERLVSVLMERPLADLVAKGIQDQAQDLRLKLHAVKKVRQARFSFDVECFSKEHGEKIEKMFRSLPEGLFLSDDSTFTKRIDPEAEGIEMYSPAHPYELRGKGEVYGQVKKVISIYEKAKEEPLVRLGTIRFEFE